VAKSASMYFCIVTDYYPRGSVDAYLDMMHRGHQTVAPSVSHNSVHARDDDVDDDNYVCLSVDLFITLEHFLE